MSVYYNEHDPFAAAWLRELIADNLIAPGVVDERSIEDVTPDELRPFRQCHFFAGIGVWSLAARRTGIPDDAPLWSGSCPCQPFSAAGKGGGFDDERHLWPAFHYLIEQCQPPIVVGEQVAGRDGDAWLDLVSADMEATGFTFGAIETVSCGFGAPHKRSRNYWMAYADGEGRRQTGCHAASDRETSKRWAGNWHRDASANDRAEGLVILADANDARLSQRPWASERYGAIRIEGEAAAQSGAVNGIWGDAQWQWCGDGWWRPVMPGTFALVDAGAFRNRVGLLRGAGNAITLGQAVGWFEAVKYALS